MVARAPYQHTSQAELVRDAFQLGRWVKDPAVLFFLGPECSQEDPYLSLGWAQLVERVEQVKAGCPSYDGVHIAAFVVSLVPEEALSLRQAVVTPEVLDPDLLTFQVAIAELAMRATELYVDVVLEPSADAVRNWSERRASVRLPDIEDSLIVLRQRRADKEDPPAEDAMPARVRRSGEYLIALDQVIDAASVLSARSEAAERIPSRRARDFDFEGRIRHLFGAAEVLRSLNQLRTLTVKEHGGLISLRGEDIEWLTNLVWHSLRFDLPIYPSNEELAFQLALLGRRRPEDSAHIARPKLSLATQDAYQPELVAEALSWVVETTMAWDGVSATSQELLDAVADVLRMHAATWHPELHSDSRYGPGRNGENATEPPSDAHEFVPVVFSTSFDQQLERAILATPGRTKVSIFVPVLVIEGARSTHAEFRWVFACTETTGSGAAAEEELESLVWQWVPTEQATWPVDDGISIVKVNGAPLYRSLDGLPISDHQKLKRLEGKRPGGYRQDAILRHALVLSEFELLRNIRIEATSSVSFLNLLQNHGSEARRVLFLGHPIHDWLTRIRLLTRLFEPVHDGRSRNGEDYRNILFAKDIEPVRASLLFWADIAPVRTDLRWVANALKQRFAQGRP